MAEVVESPILRAATHLSRDAVVALLYSYEAINMEGVKDISPKDLQHSLRQWPGEALPAELQLLQTEMILVREDG